MNKISKLLRKGGQLKVGNVEDLMQHYQKIKNKFSIYGIDSKFRDDRNYFELEVIYESILNKEAFEHCYEAKRSELFDLWDHFDYDERKACVDDAMASIKHATKHFVSDNGKTIRIAFFDELINSLYEHEMIIFELPQYFKLQSSFRDRMINIDTYRFHPYDMGFSSCELLKQDENGYILFSLDTKSFYADFYSGERYKFSLDVRKDPRHFTKETLQMVATALLTQDEQKIIDALCASNLCSKYIEHKLANYARVLKRK